MAQQIISVDIDDVLSHSARQILAYGNEHWGHVHTLEDFDEQLAAMWQVSAEEAERRWTEYMDSGNMSQLEVIPAALEALQQLGERYKIIALTSRRDALQSITKEWIATNYPGVFDQIVFAGIYGAGRTDAHKITKAEMLQQIGSAYHIDDQVKHCNGADSVGVKAILFGDYPWNNIAEIPDSVVRCKDWAAVREYFSHA